MPYKFGIGMSSFFFFLLALDRSPHSGKFKTTEFEVRLAEVCGLLTISIIPYYCFLPFACCYLRLFKDEKYYYEV